MNSGSSTWERRLVDLAHETACIQASEANARAPEIEEHNFQLAVQACEAMTAEHSRSFYLASGLLPAEKRRAIRVLYAFCRTADDLADGNVDRPAEKLRELRKNLLRPDMGGDGMLSAWVQIRERYQIPRCYAEQLLDGVERDLIQRRYNTFEELSVYCYGVASTVGLMSMRITGFSSMKAVPYAIKLGVALQLTNILRDVGEDWRAGRLYLPLEELSAWGLDEQDIDSGVVTERWRTLMRYQIARARRLYQEAMPGIALLHRDGRLAVAAAALIYREILANIERHDYDVFNRRAQVSNARKLALLPRALAYARVKPTGEFA